MNHELNELIENADIVRFIKSRRIAWLGHVMLMDKKRTPKRVLEWKPLGTRIRGRPRKRWIVDVEGDILRMGIRGWRKLGKGGMEENHWEGYNPQWVVTPVKEEEEPSQTFVFSRACYCALSLLSVQTLCLIQCLTYSVTKESYDLPFTCCCCSRP